ncbi:MAG: NAD-binding protein [Candidatus Omnitrophica bacterium]|nr:NAD-binding protein [Candidatus Omnitrophota bacterium]
MRVIIVGMGSIGTQLAKDLSQRPGMELVLVDSNEEKCEDFSRDFDALVLHGDGTESGLLNKASAREADALVATTESDALNTVIGMMAKKLNVPKIVVKLNDINLRTACKEIGIDYIISPTISAATEISSVLHGYDILDFSLLIRGGTRLIELSPGDTAGKKLKDIDLPDGSLIISIIREHSAVVPKGNAEIMKDDILLILAESEKILDRLKDIFGELKKARRSKENNHS